MFWTFHLNATAADIRQGRSSARATQTGPVLYALSFSHFSMFSLRLFEPDVRASSTEGESNLMNQVMYKFILPLVMAVNFPVYSESLWTTAAIHIPLRNKSISQITPARRNPWSVAICHGKFEESKVATASYIWTFGFSEFPVSCQGPAILLEQWGRFPNLQEQ